MKLFRAAIGLAGLAALAVGPALVIESANAGAASTDVEFATVGSSAWTVPDGVSCVSIDAIGAQGGTSDNPPVGAGAAAVGDQNGAGVSAAATSGALGAEAISNVPVLPGQVLQVDVGGAGGDALGVGTSSPGAGPFVGGTGGFNGGGAGGGALLPNPGNNEWAAGAGGGGASDVRAFGSGLANRVVVAGGGGGAGGFGGGAAGAGGDPDGGNASDHSAATGGQGGTASAGGAGGTTGGDAATGATGALGQGGAGAENASTINGGGGGGGGGVYGGGGGGGVLVGNGSAAGGGGGSSLGNTLTAGVDGGNGGNGTVTISYTVGDTSCLDAPLTVKKVTTGAAAMPGQTFTVHVDCSEGDIDGRSFGHQGSLSSVDLTFTADASGTVQPASGYTFGFNDPDSCTVTETQAGGAVDTTFACVGSGAVGQASADWGGVRPAAVSSDDPCQTSGPQEGSIGVDIVSAQQAATVTVTNTLVAAVEIAPKFTG